MSRSHRATLPMTIPTREETGAKDLFSLCQECLKARALASGLCLRCTNEALAGEEAQARGN